MKYRDLHRPVARAKEILKALQSKYPSLDAYLVVSSRLGQIEPGLTGGGAINNFPALFLDGEHKQSATQVLQHLKTEERKSKYSRSHQDRNLAEKKAVRLRGLLDHLVNDLDLDDQVHIELRFGELRYDVVRALQRDPLVDLVRTPLSNSSIRIVIGTLLSLGSGVIAAAFTHCIKSPETDRTGDHVERNEVFPL